MVILLTVPYVIQTWHIYHETLRYVQRGRLLLEPPKENGEQEIGKPEKLLTTTLQIEIENRKVEGLITYSTEQQSFKIKVNSENNQQLWGVNTDSNLRLILEVAKNCGD